MSETIKNSTVLQATGKSAEEWFSLIEKNKKGNLPHKEIAEFLHRECGLTSWWSQEVTVLFEKHTGRRVTGQTADAGFQVGVSKTLPVSAEKIWDFLTSPAGFGIVTGEIIDPKKIREAERTGKTGIQYKITTLKPCSHLRMRWRLPDWKDYSILQVRVSEKGNGKTVLIFHQEKLADSVMQKEMKRYWKEQFTKLSALLTE